MPEIILWCNPKDRDNIMRVLKAQRLDSKKYFYTNKRYPFFLVGSAFVSVLIGVMLDPWQIGAFVMVLLGLGTLYDYYRWNKRMHILLKNGVFSEKQARDILDGQTVVPDTEPDVFWDPTNAGLPYNAWHKDK